MPEYTIQRYRKLLAIVWIDESGGRHRHSLGTADRTVAEATARAFWERRSVAGKIDTVGQAVEAYLKAKAEMLSIRRAKVAWKAAERYWGRMPISRIDEHVVEAYGTQERPHCKLITVRNELAVIRAALNWAAKKKLIGAAPFIGMPKLPESEVGHLSKEQFRQLLAGARRPHVKLFMQLAVATGARSNALLDLTWDRVDFDLGIIKLNRAGRVQTSKYRSVVPMNAQIRGILAEAKEGALSEFVIEHGRAKVGSIRKGFEAASERSGIEATPHMLRHSAAVWMAMARTPMPEIAQYLGHSDSRITERVYARFSPDFLAGAADALTW